MKKILALLGLLGSLASAQQTDPGEYKKRALDAAEIDFLSSYYQQDGQNAAVTGGIGTESLTDGTATIVVSVPLNEDDILGVDAGISAYTSASSSNIDPFDGPADPFVASSGASGSDLWTNAVITYTHHSDDRNRIWSGHLSVSAEYDYYSLGLGASRSWLFNDKNTEFSLKGNVYFDTWNTIYPYELRPFAPGRNGLADALFLTGPITGSPAYNPSFEPFSKKGRNSYSLGLGFSQILTKNLQGSLALDLVYQQGLLSTPFQRVYFADVDDSFLRGFHLAEAIEQLPNGRFKFAAGTRLHYYINEILSLRTFYRFYSDDWGLTSHTASLEVPFKVSQYFTLYPSYRYYSQSAADYFAPYNQHLSTAAYATSDYDLSGFHANQYGMGISYTDLFTRLHIFQFGLKRVDLKFYKYDRNSPFSSFIITGGVNFVMDR